MIFVIFRWGPFQKLPRRFINLYDACFVFLCLQSEACGSRRNKGKEKPKRTSALPSHPLTAKVRKPFLPTVAVTLSKGGIKPSKLLSYTQTNRRTKTSRLNTKKGLSLTFLLLFSLHSSPHLSQPVHDERKAFVAVLRKRTYLAV